MTLIVGTLPSSAFIPPLFTPARLSSVQDCRQMPPLVLGLCRQDDTLRCKFATCLPAITKPSGLFQAHQKQMTSVVFHINSCTGTLTILAVRVKRTSLSQAFAHSRLLTSLPSCPLLICDRLCCDNVLRQYPQHSEECPSNIYALVLWQRFNRNICQYRQSRFCYRYQIGIYAHRLHLTS